MSSSSAQRKWFIPRNWSVYRIMQNLWVTKHMAQTIKDRGWYTRAPYSTEHRGGWYPRANFITDLETSKSRCSVRYWLLLRDGYWFDGHTLMTTCQICHKPMLAWEATIDHVIPKHQGGSNRFGNLQLSHFDCNCEKGGEL
ncbi:HNH endonuclease [candidate division WWE3 bacterium]|uniref:HNH endonuclease n=1 Tax=candidate division WWE3 bacterium TaxID=2053526 RepID=A0A955RPR6_UNCKA|nr:HNH endonuclease [candidate division WWE3 bacterium]